MIDLSSFSNPATAVIVGANGGIGRAFCDHLEEHPNITTLVKVTRGAGESSFPCDFTTQAGLDALAEHLARIAPIHIAIIATGMLQNQTIQPEKTTAALTHTSLATLFTANTVVPALVVKTILPYLETTKKSVIGVLSARVGSISDNQLGGWHSYRASKAALNMLIKTIAIELKRTRPNAICIGLHPGTVATPLSAPFQKNVPTGKLFSPQQATQRLLDVLNSLTPAHSGECIDYAGNTIPA